MRLASLGAGKWQNSGGDKAKFGLTRASCWTLWKRLRDAGLGDCLQLLHFHMGSQISNVRDIANGMREATRYFVELSRLARACATSTSAAASASTTRARVRARTTRSTTTSATTPPASQPLAEPARSTGWRRRASSPNAGAMTAHHAVLVANVSEVERAPEGRVPESHADESHPVRQLRDAERGAPQRPAVEVFHEAAQAHAEGSRCMRWGRSTGPARAHRRPVLRHRACGQGRA